MLYRYDEKRLIYEEVKQKSKWVIFAPLFLLGVSCFFFLGRYTSPEIIRELEGEIIVLHGERPNSMDQDFSRDKLIEEIKRLNIKFPHIVMAQSIIETGHWTSEIFMHNHNLFGMKEARIRVNTAEGTNLNHAYYRDWKESLYDYAFYQCRYLGKIKTEEEYFQYLSGSYAESPKYVSALKSVIKEEELKKIFE
jgi:hypothetical protein